MTHKPEIRTFVRKLVNLIKTEESKIFMHSDFALIYIAYPKCRIMLDKERLTLSATFDDGVLSVLNYDSSRFKIFSIGLNEEEEKYIHNMAIQTFFNGKNPFFKETDEEKFIKMLEDMPYVK